MKQKEEQTVAIILAGGSGERMPEFSTPKQFLPLGDYPLIIHSLRQFDQHPKIDTILVVLQNGKDSIHRDLFSQYKTRKPLTFVPAGKTRQESSFHALSFLKETLPSTSLTAIHDAARPFLTQELITTGLDCAKKYGAASPVIPIRDSLIKITPQQYSSVDRTNLFAVQTPQCFQFSLIWKAHTCTTPKDKITDDASLLQFINHKVHHFNGTLMNFKVTDIENYRHAQKMQTIQTVPLKNKTQ